MHFFRKMGNKLARNRLKAQDFHYIAKNTAFLTNDVSTRAYIPSSIMSCVLCVRLCWIITMVSWRRVEPLDKWTATPSNQSLGRDYPSSILFNE